MNYRIPFNHPSIIGNELAYISDAISSGHISGDGNFSKKCQALLETALGAPKVLLTTSCTDALEMSALLLDIQPGDEVIIPSFTFVSTANAFVLRGAKPVFIDIRQDTLNLDEKLLEALVSSRTKAIVLVHYAGVGCELDTILKIAARYQIPVVEDNAHGLFGKFRGKHLGTWGTVATLSFHETKNFSCGEGGALIVNDVRYVERAEILREKGTNRSLFFRGQIDKYTWVDIGSSYLPSDISAAFLYAQLEAREKIQVKRKQIWDCYMGQLQNWARINSVRMPCIPAHCEQSYHMFYLILPDGEKRDNLMAYLKELGILSVFHYLPLHLSPMGQRLGGKKGQCPMTEDISQRLLRLPFYNDMTEMDQAGVIEAILSFRGF